MKTYALKTKTYRHVHSMLTMSFVELVRMRRNLNKLRQMSLKFAINICQKVFLRWRSFARQFAHISSLVVLRFAQPQA